MSPHEVSAYKRHTDNYKRYRRGRTELVKVSKEELRFTNGMALSIGTEFIENPNGEVTVQDCELKAFCRLAGRLKMEFRQVKICFLLDGLYANKPVIDILSGNIWKYIITFKIRLESP